MKPDNSPTWRELLHPDVSDTIVSMFEYAEMIKEAMEMDEPHPLDPMDEAKELKHIEQL